MKKLLIIPMLFACYMCIGQTDSASIIGKPVIVGNLVIAQNDFPKQMLWEDAKKACEALGGTTHTIGETFGGGIVFYITDGGLHGLIAETQNQSSSCTWYNAQVVISNPNNHSTEGAKFTDWRLPTKDEHRLLFSQRAVVGGFAKDGYWSSTDYNANYAWYQNFPIGNQTYDYKGFTFSVRAIRAF